MLRKDLRSYPRLHQQTQREKSQTFVWNFCARYRHFVLRLTGGCKLDDRYVPGLQSLEDALTGNGCPDAVAPQFTGFALYGGTRLKTFAKPDDYLPGITEVLPKIRAQLTQAAVLGVVAKRVADEIYTPWGVVINEEPEDEGSEGERVVATASEDDTFTVIHPTANAHLVLAASGNSCWRDEYTECFYICDQLEESGWGSLLLVYNGGKYPGEEIELWANHGKNILIIDGSGRVCDQYARDKDFLQEHPNVHVAQNEVSSIRSKLLELGALTYSR